MQTTKQILRAPFLGRQHSGIATTHGNEADAPRRVSNRPPIEIVRPLAKSYTSHELFGDSNELSILHRDERYKLRITSLGKLILTK